MSFGKGLLVGHWITLRRFVRTFAVGHGRTGLRRGGGYHLVDLWSGRRPRGEAPVVRQDAATEGLFTVEYPDERLPVNERGRVLPVLIYDSEDGHIRCVSCNICAKVCPPQCIWIKQAKKPDGKPVPQPSDFYVDMDVCMNCGLCAEYCPFDAIKMDHTFELANSERHQSHIFTMQDLLVSSDYYAATHPEAYASEDEAAERAKVAKKKAQRAEKARAAATSAGDRSLAEGVGPAI
jgi:NADH-quinone oxidoreductase subunit I